MKKKPQETTNKWNGMPDNPGESGWHMITRADTDYNRACGNVGMRAVLFYDSDLEVQDPVWIDSNSGRTYQYDPEHISKHWDYVGPMGPMTLTSSIKPQ
jgi:hypothetical protein